MPLNRKTSLIYRLFSHCFKVLICLFLGKFFIYYHYSSIAYFWKNVNRSGRKLGVGLFWG